MLPWVLDEKLSELLKCPVAVGEALDVQVDGLIQGLSCMNHAA